MVVDPASVCGWRNAVVRHGGARGAIHHVVDKVFLVGKAVDRVLVLPTLKSGLPPCTRRRRQGRHGGRVVGAPATPGASHKHVVKALRHRSCPR